MTVLHREGSKLVKQEGDTLLFLAATERALVQDTGF